MSPFLLFTLVLVRMLSVFTLFPLFTWNYIPVKVRVLLAVTMAVLISAHQFPELDGSLTGMWNAAAESNDSPDIISGCVLISSEILLGLGLGSIPLFLFAALDMAGRMMGISSGMMFPVEGVATGESAPALTHFFVMLGVALFFCCAGHRIMMEAVLETFRIYPPGEVVFTQEMFTSIKNVFIQGFSLAVHIALPLMCIFLMAQFCMAVLGRTIPQMNVFTLNFNVCTLLALIILAATLGTGLALFQEAILNFST